MKKYLVFLYKNIIKLIVCLFVSFVLSFFVVNQINLANAVYTASFQVENIELFDDALLTNTAFLNQIKDSASKYNNIDVEKMIENNHFTYTKKLAKKRLWSQNLTL